MNNSGTQLLIEPEAAVKETIKLVSKTGGSVYRFPTGTGIVWDNLAELEQSLNRVQHTRQEVDNLLAEKKTAIAAQPLVTLFAQMAEVVANCHKTRVALEVAEDHDLPPEWYDATELLFAASEKCTEVAKFIRAHQDLIDAKHNRVLEEALTAALYGNDFQDVRRVDNRSELRWAIAMVTVSILVWLNACVCFATHGNWGWELLAIVAFGVNFVAAVNDVRSYQRARIENPVCYLSACAKVVEIRQAAWFREDHVQEEVHATVSQDGVGTGNELKVRIVPWQTACTYPVHIILHDDAKKRLARLMAKLGLKYIKCNGWQPGETGGWQGSIKGWQLVMLSRMSGVRLICKLIEAPK